MKRFTKSSALLPLVLSCTGLHAAGQIDCSGDSFSQMGALAQLPSEVRVALKKDRNGLEVLVDRGDPFESTDVGSGPRRRFVTAAVSAKRIFVAVEHGGRGYNVERWVFARRDGVWDGEQVQSTFNPPRTLSELTSEFCK